METATATEVLEETHSRSVLEHELLEECEFFEGLNHEPMQLSATKKQGINGTRCRRIGNEDRPALVRLAEQQ